MSTPAILRHRRDTAANWTTNNPVLEAGQIGYETDTRRFKFGNGSTAWNSLAYGVGALADGDVTYAKIQDTSAGSVLLGRGSSGPGDVQEITVGSGLVMTGTTLTATGGGGGAPSTADYLVKTADAGLSAERVVTDSTSITANWSTAGQVAFQRAALTGDVTATANSNATTIANGVVSTAKLGGDITTAGKALLDDADAAAQRTTLGLGTLATQSGTFSGTSSGTNTGDQTITLTGDVTGSGTSSFAATIASGAVSTSKLGGDITTAGKALLDDADASAQRTTLGLGTLATQSGTFSGTSSGTNTGDQTITLTGDVTGSGTGSFAATIANDAVTNAKLANVATSTIKGRVTAGTGDPEDLTGTQATTLLDVFTSSLKGVAPASGGGTTNFLRADGTWAAPAGGGTSAQVDTYTTTGTVHTWSKPSGAKAIEIIAHGAGGGGGGGAGNASAVNRTGGGGGGGGACTKIIYEASQVPSSLYVIVGLAGTGGASQTAGVAGTNSTVASNNTNPPTTGVFARAGGGGGGGPGGTGDNGGGGGGGCGGAGATSASSAAVAGGLPAIAFTTAAVGGQGGGGGYSNSSYAGRAEWGGGGGASTRAANDFRSAGGGSMYGGGGGGCGVGLNGGGAASGGSGGGPSGSYEGSAAVGGLTATLPGGNGNAAANGTAGTAAGTTYSAGGGGGGGGANNAGTGYTGGAGGFPAGGGGGGGASSTATSGGVGGAGANGQVVIITYF